MKRFIFPLLILLASAAGLAQEPSDVEALRQRVRELERQVEALRAGAPAAELDELKRQIEILTREIEALKVERQPAALADTPQFGLGSAASKVYRSAPGISFGGYGEALYENFDEVRQDDAPSGRRDQFDFLRAILYTGYKFSDRVIFNSELEVEHATTGGGVGEVSLEFAYLDFLLRPEANVRAGMVLMPVGLVNELHEPTAFLSARRPLVEQQIIPTTWRELGVGVFGDLGPVTYRTYLTTGLRSDRFSSSGIRSGRQQGGRALAEDFAFVARADWNVLEGTRLGGSFYRGGADQDAAAPADMPEFDATVQNIELHVDTAVRGFLLRGLISQTSIDGAAQINRVNGLTGDRSVGEELEGWYVEAGYDLASLFERGDFSLTPFVRLERLNTQAEVPAGFARSGATDIDLTTFGISWKPIPQAVIKLDYQNNENEARTGVNQFNLALGYIF